MAAALLAVPASASSLVAAGAPDPFYCSLHTDAAKVALLSRRAAAGDPVAQAAFERPPQPDWITGQEYQAPPDVLAATAC